MRLPYEGGELVADIVLPPPGQAPADLSHQQLLHLTQALDCAQGISDIQLAMPMLDLRTKVNLLPLLQDAVPDLMAPGGLPGISSAEQLYVTQAVQQGVVTVDEEGTVVAVVTEVGAAGSAAPATPITLTFDRPYLVRISGLLGFVWVLARGFVTELRCGGWGRSLG